LKLIREKEAWLNGQVLLVDKPEGPSAFGVVKKVRAILRNKYGLKKIKVGHAGTLDPLATGLMVLCTGKATKTINQLLGADKMYSGTIKLGVQTPSWDRETAESDGPKPVSHLELADIQQAAQTFIGQIAQVPPIFSAIKKEGTRLYELARAGSDYVPEARQVTVHQFRITNWDGTLATFEAHVSKGTYIRSLAHDIGQKLGVGGYLWSLRREASGTYHVQDALKCEELQEGL
jgi:tRNA pseudouridine55 synthase